MGSNVTVKEEFESLVPERHRAYLSVLYSKPLAYICLDGYELFTYYHPKVLQIKYFKEKVDLVVGLFDEDLAVVLQDLESDSMGPCYLARRVKEWRLQNG